MFKKSFILILLSLILSSCGYEVMHKGAGKLDYRILVTEFSNDKSNKVFDNFIKDIPSALAHSK